MATVTRRKSKIIARKHKNQWITGAKERVLGQIYKKYEWRPVQLGKNNLARKEGGRFDARTGTEKPNYQRAIGKLR